MSCIILHNFGPGTWTFLPTVSALVESFQILLSVLTLDLQNVTDGGQKH